ncbi:hypothetical protein TNCV_1724781 [Trichonephila clavipes]|nr:hypothetical protein TNCV_1724781 [Trichonephila clavipes]
MTVSDATRQDDIRKFHNLELNDTKELISFFTEKLSLGKKLSYDGSSIVEHMTLSSPIELERFLVIKKDFDSAVIGRSNTGQRRPKCGDNWKLYPME